MRFPPHPAHANAPRRLRVVSPDDEPTRAQRRALHFAGAKGGATVAVRFAKVAKGEVAPGIIPGLLEREWVTHTNQVLLITKAGRTALTTVREMPDEWLDKQSQRGYTTIKARGLVDAGIVLSDPSPRWRGEADARSVEAADPRTAARAAADRARRAA